MKLLLTCPCIWTILVFLWHCNYNSKGIFHSFGHGLKYDMNIYHTNIIIVDINDWTQPPSVTDSSKLHTVRKVTKNKLNSIHKHAIGSLQNITVTMTHLKTLYLRYFSCLINFHAHCVFNVLCGPVSFKTTVTFNTDNSSMLFLWQNIVLKIWETKVT